MRHTVMAPEKSISNAERVALSRLLRSRVPDFAEAVARAFDLMPRWKAAALQGHLDRAGYLRENFFVFGDYLIRYLEGSDETFRNLYIGEAVKALYDPDSEEGASRLQSAAVLAAIKAGAAELFQAALRAEQWAVLSAAIDETESILTRESPIACRVLLVGDCLFLDIVPFIVAPLLEQGIRIVPYYATSKSPALLHEQLVAFSNKQFDLIFFSPVTYDFSPEYSLLNSAKRALLGGAAVDALVGRVWGDAQKTLGVLADLFECPIYIHNSSGMLRDEQSLRRRIKLLATQRIRMRAATEFNALLARHVAQTNAQSYPHLFVMDELAAVRRVGYHAAGEYIYKTNFQHPCRLGLVLAAQYIDTIDASARLAKKKVVVCDLDNTLWDGVIGEGSVEHFHERQRLLKALRGKGVVLAINSKNDPANVHWRGATLGDDDFVAAAISWGPKTQGMRHIQQDLNLKIKDFVFVDDRRDELELMRLEFPEMVCLDATDAATWRRFAIWESVLDPNPEMDRTLMYQQRAARGAAISDAAGLAKDRATQLSALQLKLKIFSARAGDLKRTAELINRTNQFNLEGSRTSFREVSDWHRSAQHILLLGQSEDRFGDMGITCIAIAECRDESMRLLPFVLSCRVFGYGIEDAVLGTLQRIARERGMKAVVGRYVKTAVNAPCENFLADNGFELVAGLWRWSADRPIREPPPWLSVTASL
jgi:FkbH-like protein